MVKQDLLNYYWVYFTALSISIGLLLVFILFCLLIFTKFNSSKFFIILSSMIACPW
jgi:hypothetical protein